MPRFDGTGPRGDGPVTGGGRGYCAVRLPSAPGEAPSGYAGILGRPIAAFRRLGLGLGLGLGRGRGGRRGGRRW
jgi:hypothetical protein